MNEINNSKSMGGIEKRFLIGSLLLLLLISFLFVSSFLSTLYVALIIVAAIYPIHKRIRRFVTFSRTFAAFISMLLVLVLIIVPLIFFFISLVNQASDAYILIKTEINDMDINNYKDLPVVKNYPMLQGWIEQVITNDLIPPEEVFSAVRDSVGTISSFLIAQTTNIVKNISVFILHMLVFLLALFYFIRDGDKTISYLKSIIPLPEKYRNELFQKMNALMQSIVYGIFGAAIAQGILLAIALKIVGFSNVVFWGALGAVFSPIPYIGISLIWVPFVIVLFVSQKYIAGVFLLVFCLGVVSLADNIIKPYIIGSTSALHPLAVLLVMLGGAFAFGFQGIVFGPLVLKLTLTFLHIYKLEFGENLAPPVEIVRTPIKKRKSG